MFSYHYLKYHPPIKTELAYAFLSREKGCSYICIESCNGMEDFTLPVQMQQLYNNIEFTYSVSFF